MKPKRSRWERRPVQSLVAVDPDPKTTAFIQDYPASYHNRAGGLSFADGHSEIKRWVDPRTTPPLKKGTTAVGDAGRVNSPNNKDIFWLQERCTRKTR